MSYGRIGNLTNYNRKMKIKVDLHLHRRSNQAVKIWQKVHEPNYLLKNVLETQQFMKYAFL